MRTCASGRGMPPRGEATTLRSRTAEAGTALAAAAAPSGVALRALVVAIDSGDWGVDTWKATLDRVGAAYDVLYTGTTPLTADAGAAGRTGKYNAILLTNNNLLYQDAEGGFVSGLSADEWNLLWAYERDYRVARPPLQQPRHLARGLLHARRQRGRRG